MADTLHHRSQGFLVLAQAFELQDARRLAPAAARLAPTEAEETAWLLARREKARVARRAAIEARLDREAEDQRLEAEAVIAREEEGNRKLAAQARQDEEKRRFAEAQAAEQKRLMEQRERERLAREEEEKRRLAEAEAAAQKRLAEQQLAEQRERERLAREDEENRRQQAATLAAQQTEQLRLALLSKPVTPSGTPDVTPEAESAVPVSGLAADEASRFTLEQRRLAKERLERLRPAQRENPVSGALDREGGSPATVRPDAPLAVLGPTLPSTAPSVPPSGAAADLPEVVKSVKTELKRLGCYNGPIDSALDKATRASLGKAGSSLTPASPLMPVTGDILLLLKSKQSRLCGEISCQAGQVRKGNSCIAAREPERGRARETETPRKTRAVAREAAPARHPQVETPSRAGAGAGRSRCFSFNGGQYCE